MSTSPFTTSLRLLRLLLEVISQDNHFQKMAIPSTWIYPCYIRSCQVESPHFGPRLYVSLPLHESLSAKGALDVSRPSLPEPSPSRQAGHPSLEAITPSLLSYHQAHLAANIILVETLQSGVSFPSLHFFFATLFTVNVRPLYSPGD